jgi:hypothetical protein
VEVFAYFLGRERSNKILLFVRTRSGLTLKINFTVGVDGCEGDYLQSCGRMHWGTTTYDIVCTALRTQGNIFGANKTRDVEVTTSIGLLAWGFLV